MKNLARLLILASALMMLPDSSSAQLRVARVIGDHMVMQRGAEVPVWGWAAPGAQVVVAFDGSPYPAEADDAGAWRVVLPEMDAGGPHTMTITSGDQRLDVRDILVGDVWVASGQSNMEWVLADAEGGTAAVAAADDPQIRHFKVPRGWAETPEAELPSGAWEVADPDHAGGFSAVGYYFARALRPHVNVPIGLLHTSWGGSRIEPWMSAEVLALEGDSLSRVLAAEKAYEERVLAGVRARLGGELPLEDGGLVDGIAHWAAPDLDVSDWDSLPVPATWESAGYDGMDGIGWYRTAFTLTAEEARQGVKLALAFIDDSDISYVNGHEGGRMTLAWNKPRLYDVPASALRSGTNVVAVRVEDTGGGGGIYGDPALLYVEVGGERRPLAGRWRFKVGVVTLTLESHKNQVPTLLWNKMVHPLLPFPIKGALWYQGESNADRPEDAVAYRDLFPKMITGWREAWGVGDFPFLWVQLANFKPADAAPPAVSNWALLRESQTAALRLPHTGQAVITDVGDADDIHPRDKKTVGERLALAARHVAYGEDVVYSGPIYQRHEIRDGRVHVSFDHVGGGLVARGGDALGGFALAGADGMWHRAEGRIDGDAVVVWSEAVPQPVAVRYAWADNPAGANLYNAEGLPASSFRTDAPGVLGRF